MSEAFHSNTFEVGPPTIPSSENYGTGILGSGKLSKTSKVTNDACKYLSVRYDSFKAVFFKLFSAT